MVYLTEQFQTRFHKNLEIFDTTKSRISVSKLKQSISAILNQFLNFDDHFQVRFKLTPVIKSLDGLVDAHKRYIISEKANFFSADYQKRNRFDMQLVDDVLKKVKVCLDKLTIEDNRQLLVESISDLLHQRDNDDTIAKPPAVKKTRRSSSNSTETVSNETNEVIVVEEVNKQSKGNDNSLLMMDIGDLDFLNNLQPDDSLLMIQPGTTDNIFADFDAFVKNKESVDVFHNDFVHNDSFDALFDDIMSK